MNQPSEVLASFISLFHDDTSLLNSTTVSTTGCSDNEACKDDDRTKTSSSKFLSFLDSHCTRTKSSESSPSEPSSSVFKLTCPSLSLHHSNKIKNRSMSNNDNSDKRQAAEEHAIALLARPLRLSNHSDAVDNGTDDDHIYLQVNVSSSCREKGDDEYDVNDVNDEYDNVPKTLLHNIVSSFAVLVDSRLHAYTVFLTRHAIAVAKRRQMSRMNDDDDDAESKVRTMKQKLLTMLYIGNQITADTISIRMEAGSTESSDPNRSASKQEQDVEVVVTLDFRIIGTGSMSNADSNAIHTNTNNDKDMTFSITFKVPGRIVGAFNSSDGKLNAITITVDTKQLLACMIEEASNVVSIIVDIANNDVSKLLSKSNMSLDVSSSSPLSDEPTITSTTSNSQDAPTKQVNDGTASNTGTGKASIATGPSPAKTLHRSASFLAMPPPPVSKKNSIITEVNGIHNGNSGDKMKKPASFHLGLNLLCQVATLSQFKLEATESQDANDDDDDTNHHNVVSPDMSGCCLYDGNNIKRMIPKFQLDPGLNLDDGDNNDDEYDDYCHTDLENNDNENKNCYYLDNANDDDSDDDVSYLSPDQCADIIDSCLCSMDQTNLLLLDSSVSSSSELTSHENRASKRIKLY